MADEAELLAFRQRFIDAEIPFSEYKEPDFDDELTALAVAPSPTTQKICASLPLALKEESLV